jgi:glycosyltransferase involved in cell wall biosynthesis
LPLADRAVGPSEEDCVIQLTVAICTWNRCRLLHKTLARLAYVGVPEGVAREVLVVNNNCTDDTNEIAASFSSTLPLRLVFEPTPGLSNARNTALRHAAGDYIVWIDDDVLVDEEWLPSLAEAVRRHPDAAAFGGPIDPWFPVDPDPVLLSVFPALRRGFCGLDYGPRPFALSPAQPLFGANMTYSLRATRDLAFNPALGRTGGTEFGGDDTEFLARVHAGGGAVMWVPGMRVRHYVDPARMTLSYLRQFSFDRGRSATRMAPAYDGPHLWGAPRWLWRAAAQRYLQYAALRFTPFRRLALEGLREYEVTRGMLAEWMARRGLPSVAAGQA